MDSSGRLHMPGFVGQTFEETGVLKKAAAERLPDLSDIEAELENPVSRQHRRALERAKQKLMASAR